jgi:hypothetical protein
LLKRRLAEVGHGHVVGHTVDKTTFEDLKELLLTDYRINGRKSLERMQLACRHLTEHLALLRAIDITPDRVARYVAERQSERPRTRRSTANWPP